MLGFFQAIILIRYLGKESYGIWSVIQAVPSMFIALSHLGIDSILLRRVAREKNAQHELFSQALVIKFILSIVFILFISLFLIISGYEYKIIPLIILYSLAHVIISYSQLIADVFRAHERFIFDAVVTVLRSFALFITTCIIVLLGLQLESLVYGALISYIILVFFCFYWYVVKFGFNFQFYENKKYIDMLKAAVPFALLTLADPIFMQINVILLSRLHSYESVAVFNAPYRIMIFLYMIPFALRKTIFPTLSKLSRFDKKEFAQFFSKSFKLITVIGFPIAFGTYFLSEKIIILLFGNEFIESVQPMKIMSIILIFNYFRQILNVTLFASDKEKIASITFIFATILNICLGLLFIPRWSYNGACYAILISEIVLMLCSLFYVYKDNVIEFIFVKTGARILLSIVTCLFFLYISSSLHLFLQVSIGLVIYTFSVFLYGVFSKEERKKICEIFLLR